MRDPETRRIKADLLLEIHASDELGCLKAKLDRYQRALNPKFQRANLSLIRLPVLSYWHY